MEKKVEIEKLFKCQFDGICKSSFKDKRGLNKHLNRIHKTTPFKEEQKFKCLVDACTKSYPSQKSLTRHNNDKHK